MRLNGMSVSVCPVHVERVDGVLITRDPLSGKVVMCNRTASLILDMIVDHDRRGSDLCARDLAAGVVGAFDLGEVHEGEVRQDVDRVISDFFAAGLLREV